MSEPGDLEARLITLIDGTPWLMAVLAEVRRLALPQGAVGAGTVRNLVFDHLHGRPFAGSRDLDVVYFDPAETSRARDHKLERRLAERRPDVPWEVTNQAGVHLWFHEKFGHRVGPLGSLEEAVASWPETCTAVAVRLGREGALEVVAPFGLEDLFAMTIRHNPGRCSLATYRARLREKRYAERWPKVRILAA